MSDLVSELWRQQIPESLRDQNDVMWQEKVDFMWKTA